MTTRIPTHKQAEKDITATLLYLEKFLTALPELLRRAEHPARDGFPSTSGSSGSPGNLGPSDPTPAVALATPPPDDVRKWILDSFDDLRLIAERARTMDGRRQLVFDVSDTERGRQNSIPNCVNPACGRSLHDQGPNGRGEAGRCLACARFRQRNDYDRPASLVNRRNESEAS